MRRPETNSALRVTVARQAQKQRRMADYRRRTQATRDRVRGLWFLTPLVQSGAVRK